jgi:hypothetical protein
VALAAADIKSGEVVVVVYDGTRFQVVSQLNSAGDARFANVSIASSLYVGGVSTFVGNAGFSANVSIASALSVGGVAAITGATTIGGNLTLSGGTANGVAYLDGSKVVTSGSVLVFDGTNLGINCTATALTNYRGAEFAGTTATTGGFLRMRTSDSSINSLDFTDSNGRAIFTTTNHPVRFGVNDAEQMRLTTTGLGLGVTPSAWGGTSGILQNSAGSLWRFGTGNIYLGQNYYYNGTNRIYINTAEATEYQQTAGQHRFYNAASGTAGNAVTLTQAMTLDASGRLGVGLTSPNAPIEVQSDSGGTGIRIRARASANAGTLRFYANDGTTQQAKFEANDTTVEVGSVTNVPLLFNTNGTERARITSGGDFLVNTTNVTPGSSNVVGFAVGASGYISVSRDASVSAEFNRKTDDGLIVVFRQDGTQEGDISVSGGTVSYNAFAGSHWSQLQDGSKPDILRGTVMESINELCVWPDETNERLPKSKVSDTAGSKKVYGVFMAWDNDWTTTNDMYITAVGAFICRVNGSVTVQEGDLLESNGDGTARVQADDIIRSSTIGKVTSTVKTHQYADGSYCVPTVLYCG